MENRRGDIEVEEDDQEVFVDEAGNLDDFDMTLVGPTADEPSRDQSAQQTW